MICRHCEKDMDDVIMMQLMRFKNGELHSYASAPVVLCLDCYSSISLGNRIFDDMKEEEEECQQS